MGTDARLYATKAKKSFYFDREYILDIGNNEFFSFIREHGIPKNIMLSYLSIVKYFTENDQEIESVRSRKYRMLWIERCIKFIEILSEDEIITSYNDQDDEYFEIAKEDIIIE